MTASVDLSVVIPAYNEEAVLTGTVEETLRVAEAGAGSVEIVIVEDASTDATLRVATELAERYPPVRVIANQQNRGKGGSVRRGMLEAGGALRLYMDADSAVSPRAIPAFREAMEAGHDVVIGSRRHPDAQVPAPQPWYRRLGGRMGNAFLIRPLLLPGYRDTQVGFKMFRAACAEDVFADLTTEGWMFDVEVLLRCEQRGYRVAVRPVTWRDRGHSSVSGADFLGSALSVLRLWWRRRRQPDGSPDR